MWRLLGSSWLRWVSVCLLSSINNGRYLQWLGRQSDLDDLASLDPDLYNGLIFLKHYEGNPEDLALNFTISVDGRQSYYTPCE
jgi:hypothetical protein